MFGQSRTAALPCEASHRIIAPKNPVRGSDGTILADQSIVEAQIAIGGDANLRVVEHPRSGKGLDADNSTIVIQKGQNKRQYALQDLVKGGEFFRLVETATVCSSRDSGDIFLAFETASTGASEAFTVVRYSPHVIKVQALPVANQGRIVVRNESEVEVWTAKAAEGLGDIECDGCKKLYAAQACHLGQAGVRCSSPTGRVGAISPDKFMRARIEVR